MADEIIHLIDSDHWSGWCESTTGVGTTDRAEVTCDDCLDLSRPKMPNIDHLIRADLRASLAERWTGSDEELDATVDDLIAKARKLGEELRKKHGVPRAKGRRDR